MKVGPQTVDMQCIPKLLFLIRPHQFDFLFHGSLLPKFGSVGRQKFMNIIKFDL